MPANSLSKVGIIGYGLGHVFNDVCASMWFTYLLLFFQKVLTFNRTNSGLLMLVGQLADGISTTLVGLLAEKFSYFWIVRAYGKRKSCHLLGSLCVTISFPFIFLPCLWPSLDEQSQMIYYSCFVVVFQFGWAATQISHLSLITDLTECEDFRTTLTSVRYGFTVISNILVYLTTWVFFGVGDGNQSVGYEDTDKFRNIMLVGMGIGISATFGFHIIVKEPSEEKKDELSPFSIEKSAVSTPKIGILSWLSNPKLYLIAAIYMSTRLFVNLSQAYIPFYLQDSLMVSATYLAIIPLIMFSSSFLTSMLASLSNKHLGRPLTWILGAMIGCAAALYIQLGAGSFLVQYGIFFVAVFIGASSCVLLITSLGLTADLIGDNTESSALIYGLMSCTDKLANGLAVVFIQRQIPCLKLYELPELEETLSTVPHDCVSEAPTGMPVEPNGRCFSFYQDVLFYSTGGSAVFGAVFVLLLISIAFVKRKQRGNEVV